MRVWQCHSFIFVCGCLQHIYNTFHVFKLVKVFSGCEFGSVIEGCSCGRKIDNYRYPKLIWVERVSFETERLHSKRVEKIPSKSRGDVRG